MRPQNVLLNTGILVSPGKPGFLGSGFAFRYSWCLLTADHCVPTDSSPLAVELPGAPGRQFPVESVQRHRYADLAILRVGALAEDDITWPQYSLFDERGWGLEYAACGYPEEFHESRSLPTARVFIGHIQRFFEHTSHRGYSYFAAERSAGAPRGLSGAPVFHSTYQGRLYGVVAENLRTVTEAETVIEVQENGSTYREVSHHVINYGIAVWLPAVAEWLDQHVPPVSDEELARRGQNQQRWREQHPGA